MAPEQTHADRIVRSGHGDEASAIHGKDKSRATS